MERKEAIQSAYRLTGSNQFYDGMITCSNLVCPLSNFAKQYGYEAYMPYLCNLDYVMFGMLGAPLFRSRTCFEDDFCDFKLKLGAKPLSYWPPVFSQENGCK